MLGHSLEDVLPAQGQAVFRLDPCCHSLLWSQAPGFGLEALSSDVRVTETGKARADQMTWSLHLSL